MVYFGHAGGLLVDDEGWGGSRDVLCWDGKLSRKIKWMSESARRDDAGRQSWEDLLTLERWRQKIIFTSSCSWKQLR